MSFSPLRILVYNATGDQGTAVVHHLLGRGHHVSALARSAAKAAPLAAAGADIALADLTDASALAAASAGHDAVLIQIPTTATPADMVAHGRRALTAAAQAGIPQVVLAISSVVPAAPTGLAGPDARRQLVELARELVPRSIVLNVPLYLDNFSGPLRPAIEHGGVIPQAIPADVPVAYLSWADYARFAAAALERPELAGRWLPLGGREALTGPELARQLGAALGRELTYQALPPAAMREMLTPITGATVAAQVAEMYEWEGTAGQALLAPDAAASAAALGVEATPLHEWAAQAFGR